MYSIKHELYIFRISNNNNKNKQTNKQTNKQKRTETEPIYRTKILRLPHTYSHYKHTHTHACIGGVTKKD